MSNDLLRDLERLSGAIDRHKTSTASSTTPRPHSYRNPNYPPAKQSHYAARAAAFTHTVWKPSIDKKDVVIGGVAFETSKNKLTRKDALAKNPTPHTTGSQTPLSSSWSSHQSHQPPMPRRKRYPRGRIPKAKNLTLTNVGRPSKRQLVAAARARKASKQCPFFSNTGLCARGNRCLYQHDPKKIAICPRFLKNDCPYDAQNCLLSHEPTPERVPLCLHFANQGRCKNGSGCLYPHFHVAPRVGVCRDFAVLGFCEKGVDCDKQHLKECPQFAELGSCNNPKCKLPHVIRANARRAVDATTSELVNDHLPPSTLPSVRQPAEEAILLADLGTTDFIPLTFEESSDEDEDAGTESPDDEDESLSDSETKGNPSVGTLSDSPNDSNQINT